MIILMTHFNHVTSELVKKKYLVRLCGFLSTIKLVSIVGDVAQW